jgi:CBS domain-containing protein
MQDRKNCHGATRSGVFRPSKTNRRSEVAQAEPRSNNQTIQEIMTADPITVSAKSSIQEAAQKMRDAHVGSLAVTDGKAIAGIVTDRDIVVRALADGKGPETPLAEVLSGQVVAVAPDDRIEKVVDLMREHAVRRIPVVDGGRLAGVISIGDLAIERDPDSALADISAARENS